MIPLKHKSPWDGVTWITLRQRRLDDRSALSRVHSGSSRDMAIESDARGT
jgi:hypothetical protein